MEPEKKEPILNNEQRNAAYCTDNAVIAAGAGSGKTMVLASRFAWLVTEKKYPVREILTLTFTRKAAAQMYRRIYLQLADIAGSDTGEKGKLAKQALDEFTQARIQTLDSYCATIVRQAANRYGINPNFTINEDRCRQLAVDTALPFLIAKRNHHAIVPFYPHKSPKSIANDIFALALEKFSHIDSPLRLNGNLRDQFVLVCREWKKQNSLIHAKIHELFDVYGENEKYHPGLAPLVKQFTSGEIIFPGDELEVYFNELITIPHDSAIEWAENHPQHKVMVTLFEFVSSICNLDLRKGAPQKNPAKELIKELKTFYGEFSALAVFCLQAGLIHSVLTLLSELQQDYLSRKRSEGILTYNDVARLAKTILLEQTDIRQSEKEAFKAIMIDEFQDNNELQKDILFLLAEKPEIVNKSIPPPQDLSPGRLFFVGDEKQSIYRFRGADVSVFRALQKELGSKDLPLKTNYRSAPQLIGAFNAIFGGSEFDPEGNADNSVMPAVFAPRESSLPLYEASFTPLRADKKSEGKLTLCILDKQDSDEFVEGETENLPPVENEARFVAERINALLQEKDETGKQKYQPHDIAILFRSRTPQYLFEKHLMLLNIPYASEDLNGFFYGGPVNDLMSVLRLAVYPNDRAAYAQVLRSPFAGLSFSGLTTCLTNMDDSSSPFNSEPLALLDEEDRIKYDNGQRVYQKIRDRTCTESIGSLVSELWYQDGYRYETEWNPKTAAYREMYDYLFHLAAQADEENQTLASFVDDIQDLDMSGERLSDIEIPLERPSTVHLITIHKSKGLEFPVVFLCCCDKQGMHDFSADIFDTGTCGITLTPPIPPRFSNNKNIKRNYFWERSTDIERGKRIAELRRLLYVGMTRAENELYLSGCLGVSKFLDIDSENPDNGSPQDDFSLLLKQFIEQKAEKAAGNNPIAGDNILGGNTFFGLCLPAFGAHIPQDGGGTSFFNIEKIPVYNEEYMRNAEQHGSLFANDQKGLFAFFKKVELFYKCANIIETPVVLKKYFSPTSLLKTAPNGIIPGKFAASEEYSGDSGADIFDKVDSMLDRYAKQNGVDGEKFNSGGFGTIAHICVNAMLSGEEAVIPSKLAGFLIPTDAEVFLSAGKELALRFAHSPLGIIASASENRKSEFAFRSLIYVAENEIFLNGTIDLVFEDEKKVYVVDFKTDAHEFPEEHIPQMACYYRAAVDLFAAPSNKECTIWLYYLRTGRAIEVTTQARDFKLEKSFNK